MAITVDQADIGSGNDPGSGVTSVAMTTDQTVAAGATIILGVGWFGSTFVPSNVTGGGLSWTVDKAFDGVTSSGGSAVIRALAASGLPSGTTITVTFGGIVDIPNMSGMSLLGVLTSSPVDGTPLQADAGTGQTSWSSGSYAIQAGSVIVAHTWHGLATTTNTPTAPSIEAWEDQFPTDNFGSVMEYRIESSSGSYTVAGSITCNNPTTATVAYLAAPVVITSASILSARHAIGTGRW